MQLLLYTFAHILFSTVSYLSLQSYLIVLFLLIFIMWFLFNCLVLIDLSSLAEKLRYWQLLLYRYAIAGSPWFLFLAMQETTCARPVCCQLQSSCAIEHSAPAVCLVPLWDHCPGDTEFCVPYLYKGEQTSYNPFTLFLATGHSTVLQQDIRETTIQEDSNIRRICLVVLWERQLWCISGNS